MDATHRRSRRPRRRPSSPVGARRAAGAATLIALSPINQRRWENFKANRRGYWSFWIFLVLFVLSLFAEFIANDKPFYRRYDGKSYFPAVFTYPETDIRRRFRDRGRLSRSAILQKLIAEKGGNMIWPPIRYSYDTTISICRRRRPRSRPGC